MGGSRGRPCTKTVMGAWQAVKFAHAHRESASRSTVINQSDLYSHVAKGNFRVFLIYELGAGPAPGAEQRFSLADFLRYYSVIFIRVKLLTRDL